jgi:nucleoside-diphosphate-sugar epimerase
VHPADTGREDTAHQLLELARLVHVGGIVPVGARAPSLCAVDSLAPPDTIVVTGAAGWLGRALLDRFDRSPHDSPRLVALVHTADEADAVAAISPDARVEVADVTDPDALTRALSSATGVTDLVHTVGVIHPTRFADFDAVNHLGTRHVLAAASGVRRLVHVSSNSPFGTNPTPRDTFGEHEPYHPYLGYGRSKMAAELAVAEAVEAGLDAVVVRPPWFYGPFQPARQTTFFTMVRTGRFPVFGAGKQRRSMVYVHNLADGVLAALRTDGIAGRAYWIADDSPYTVDEIVGAVRDALEANGLPCRDRDLRLPLAVARAAERVDRLLQARGRYQSQVHVLGEMGHSIAVDIAAARRDLGYEPSVALAEGMRASVAWCLDQGYEL